MLFPIFFCVFTFGSLYGLGFPFFFFCGPILSRSFRLPVTVIDMSRVFSSVVWIWGRVEGWVW